MGPVESDVLATIINRIPKIGKCGVGQSRVLDVGLTEQVAAKQLIFGGESVVHPDNKLVVVANQRLLVNKVREARSVGRRKGPQGYHLLGYRINVGYAVARDGIPDENRLPCFSTATRATKERLGCRIEKLAVVEVEIGRPSAATQIDGVSGQHVTEITTELFGIGDQTCQ